MRMKVDSLLAFTLIDMSRTRTLAEITVTDILKESGVSRTYIFFLPQNIFVNRSGCFTAIVVLVCSFKFSSTIWTCPHILFPPQLPI